MDGFRRELCRACRLLYERGYVVGHDGNLSLRLEGDRVVLAGRAVLYAECELMLEDVE